MNHTYAVFWRETKYLFVMAAWMIATAASAQACQVYTFEYALTISDLVFVGRPTKFFPLPEAADGRKPSDVVFEVKRHLRGPRLNTLTIRDRGNGCYRLAQFAPGKEYLVFAAQKDGRFETYHPLPNYESSDGNARIFIEKLASE